MEDEDDTVTGGEELSIEEAAAAFAKSTSEGAEDSQPEDGLDEQGENAEDDLQEPEEGESEEDGEPEDDESQPEDDDETEPESEHGRYVAHNGRVRLPDGTESTVSDLIQGNLRDRDYRQKTMSHAEAVKAFEAQSSAFKASEEKLVQEREYMNALLQSIIPEAPDPSLLQEDPVKYMQMKDHYERLQQHAQYIRQQTELQKQEAEKNTAAERQKRANDEWERLQEAVPDLKDKDKGIAFASDIQKYGQEYGYSLQEIADSVPYDHRQALVLRDAIKWRKLQASKPKAAKKTEGRPPVQRGGKRHSQSSRRAAQASDAMNRLKKSGSVDDAAAAYLASKG